MSGITNATKANVIAALNALLGLLIAFGVPLSDTQTASILVFANTLGAVLIGFTYKDSAKRVPEGAALLTFDKEQK